MYKCIDCGQEFSTPKSYREEHGESIAICPKCSSTEFDKWDPSVEKIEVARTLVNVVAALNRLQNNIADVFGNSFKNQDLEYAQEITAEFIEELYDDFLPNRFSIELRKATTSLDVDRIMLRLEG